MVSAAASATNSGVETNAASDQTAVNTASQSDLTAAAPRDGSVIITLYCFTIYRGYTGFGYSKSGIHP